MLAIECGKLSKVYKLRRSLAMVIGKRWITRDVIRGKIRQSAGFSRGRFGQGVRENYNSPRLILSIVPPGPHPG